MTDAEKALEALDSGDISWQMWLMENDEVIRRALKIAAAVDGDGLVMEKPCNCNETICYADAPSKANNDLLERLRGIK